MILALVTGQVWFSSLYGDGVYQRTTFGDTCWWTSSLRGRGYQCQDDFHQCHQIWGELPSQVGQLLTFVDENRVTVAVNNTLSRSSQEHLAFKSTITFTPKYE